MAEESRQSKEQAPQHKGTDRHTPSGHAAPDPNRDEFLRRRQKVTQPQTMPNQPRQYGMGGKGSRRPPPHHGAGHHR
jgi:hypothetical protein